VTRKNFRYSLIKAFFSIANGILKLYDQGYAQTNRMTHVVMYVNEQKDRPFQAFLWINFIA